jgi:hypothetical protein
VKLTLITQITQDTNNLFHVPYVQLETKGILSKAFPDVVNNKEVISGDYFKWFTLRSDKVKVQWCFGFIPSYAFIAWTVTTVGPLLMFPNLRNSSVGNNLISVLSSE